MKLYPRSLSLLSALFLLACSSGESANGADDGSTLPDPDAGIVDDSGDSADGGLFEDADVDSAADADVDDDDPADSGRPKDGGPNDAGGTKDSGGGDSGGDGGGDADVDNPPPAPGTLLWTRFFDGGEVLLPGYQQPKGAGANAVAVDDQGFIWVVGHEAFFTGSTNAPTPVLLKIDPEGKLVFKKKPSTGAGMGTGFATGVVLDGEAARISAERSVHEYSARGDLKWSLPSAFQSGSTFARPRLLGAPLGSLVYVNQTTMGKNIVVKVAPDGSSAQSMDVDASFGSLRDAAIDAAGNVLLAGAQDVSTVSGNRSTSSLVRATVDGDVLGMQRFYAASFSEDAPTSRESTAVAADPSGDVYLAGREQPAHAASNHAYSIHFIERRSADGELVWDFREVTPGNFAYYDQPSAMRLGGSELVVAGTQNARISAISLDGDSGGVLWRASVALGTNSLTTTDVALGPGRVYVVGRAGPGDTPLLFVAAFSN